MKQYHYINGIEVNDPINHAAVQIDLSYEKNNLKEAVSLTEWEFGVGETLTGNDGFEILKAIRENGLSGGVGVTEGVPFILDIEDDSGNVYTLFDGYLDLWRATYGEYSIKATAVERGQADWLNEVVDSYSFEYLFEIGELRSEDFVLIPYVINRKQNALENIIAIATLYFMIQNLRRAIQYMADTINDYDIIYISMVIRLIAQIIQIIAMIVAIVDLAADLYQTIVQPIKYHYGMYFKDLLRIGLAHKGLKFESSFLNTDPMNTIFLLPKKRSIKEHDIKSKFANIQGIVSLTTTTTEKRGYPEGTFGEFLRSVITMFNAKWTIIGDTFYLEKQNWNLQPPSYELPEFETQDETLNADEYYSNILISFATDLNDRNTIQEYTGTSVQIIQRPKAINNKAMTLTRNFENIQIPYALGKRKTSLTYFEQQIESVNLIVEGLVRQLISLINNIEKAVKTIVKTTNKFIKSLSAVGIKLKFNLKVPPMPRGIDKVLGYILSKVDKTRIGMLMMESDYVAVPKVLMIPFKENANKRVLRVQQTDYLSGLQLWEQFHSFKSFVPRADGWHNQYVYKPIPEIPFTIDDYKKVRGTNSIFDSEGNEAELVSLKYNPILEKASGRIKVKQLYTNNLELVIIEPNGK